MPSSITSDRLGSLISSLLESGVGARFVATGQSMDPAIRDGEPIVVQPVTAEELVRGMVVLCHSGGRLLAHRIVRVDRVEGGVERVHTRGDAVGGGDHPVLLGEILGRVAAVVRDQREVPLGRHPERLDAVSRARALVRRVWAALRR